MRPQTIRVPVEVEVSLVFTALGSDAPGFRCHKVGVEHRVRNCSCCPSESWRAYCNDCRWYGTFALRMDSAQADAYEHMRETGADG